MAKKDKGRKDEDKKKDRKPKSDAAKQAERIQRVTGTPRKDKTMN